MTRIIRRPWTPIFLVALLARLPGVVSKPLWYDETIAILLSAKGPAAMITATVTVEDGVAANVHPLGYFSLLWAWGRVFGTSPLAARSLSVLIGLGVVAAGYMLTRKLFDRRSAILLGAVMALSPFQVHYAQEVRMYGLLTLLLLAAAILFTSAMQESRWWRWLGFALLAAAAQYIHALAGLVLLPLAAIPLMSKRWRALRATILSGTLALLLYLPWLLILPQQIGRVQQSYWIGRPGIVELVRTLVIFLGGSPLPEWGLPLVLFSLVLLLLVIVMALRRGRLAGEASAYRASWVAYMSAAPLLLMFLISQWQPVYLDRAMLPSGVAFLIVLTWALAGEHIAPKIRWTAWTTLAASFAMGLFSFYTYRGFPYAPYQEMASFLVSERSAGEAIIHSNKITALPSAYYSPDLDHRFVADTPGSGSDTLAPATQRALGMLADVDVSSATGEAAGVWFVVFDKEIKEYAELGLPQHPSLHWLRMNFAQEETHRFGEVQLHHFWERRESGRAP